MPDHCDETLRTVRDVVAALGKPNKAVVKAAAALLGVGPPAVTNWLTAGCFPPARYLQISALLAERGKKADPSLFRKLPRTKSDANAA